MAKQPSSWWAAAEEIQTSKPHDKVTSGGKQSCGPYDEESCERVENTREREPSLGRTGEGHARCEGLGEAAPPNPPA